MTKSRDSYFDNAKFILIFLVVFGHILRSFINGNEFMLHLYKFIYTFHMPAFILVSGYFAKNFKRKGYVKKLAVKLIIPYLIFQGIYSVFYYLIQDESMASVNPIDPQWSLWFLVSLFFWNLLLYPFTKLPKMWALGASCGLAVMIGYLDFISSTLSLSRTFVFLPMFLVGFYLKKRHFDLLRAKRGRQIAAGVLGIVFLLCWCIDFDYSWLFGSEPYSTFGTVSLLSGLSRIGWYVLAFAATFSFLALVPQKRYFFTKWGTRTFYVYLLHGFIIKTLRQIGLEDHLSDYQNLVMLLMLTAALTSILSSNAVKTAAQPFIELRITGWLEAVKGTRNGAYSK
ncbi:MULTISPECIES: acyltransferase family protein [Bacillus]|uniref:acyltransferase family protein n=1 Tax=Bacillus TaxID=1386 RepID=UPI00077D7DE4|nr:MULTISPECIES: acyltransferase family protein [Bacillus]AMQ70837.1 acyltransferase [Bacillus amyloliquefaciens UMAF6639]MCA1215546.1 acyltransferase family protein [Bacillus amyloliquefaciens]MCC8303985.1 acyltransferase family protein [Bacillus sp. AF12]MCM3371465.1 acyltransferase family protein [Bacillus velezensis]MCM3445352.1 acyltransferase family protein [Bacillus velezensis]